MSGEEQSGKPVEEAGEDPSLEVQETLKLAPEEIIKRRSRWQSSLAALRYVYSVSNDNDVKVRDSDRATSIWLLIVCVFAFVSLIIPALAGQRLPMILASDVLIGAVLIVYVANRFGIVTTFTPRQAYLTWQLMLGSSLLGIFVAMNLAIIIGLVVSQTHIQVPR